MAMGNVNEEIDELEGRHCDRVRKEEAGCKSVGHLGRMLALEEEM